MNALVEEITRLYDEDQRSGRRPDTADDIPIHYEDITAEWLTAVICAGHPDIRVVDFRLGDVDNGSSNRRRITVSYNDPAAAARQDLPTVLFCKASQDLLNRILFGACGTAHGEVTFYRHIRPELNIEAPVACHAAYDPQSFNSIIMMRDLGEGVRFCDHTIKVDEARAQEMLGLLARLHGTFYQDPRLTGPVMQLPTWPEHFQRGCAIGMEDFTNKGFLAARDVIPAALYDRYPEIWPATMRSVTMHNDLPRTLIHSDVHLKNWYLRPEGRMGLGDWQCISVGHWSRDLAYAMATMLDIEDRRRWERDLVRAYLQMLAEAGGQRIGFDEAWTLYRSQLFTALAYWTVTLTPSPEMPDMQPLDVTMAFIGRIAAAMDDLDALSAV